MKPRNTLRKKIESEILRLEMMHGFDNKFGTIKNLSEERIKRHLGILGNDFDYETARVNVTMDYGAYCALYDLLLDY